MLKKIFSVTGAVLFIVAALAFLKFRFLGTELQIDSIEQYIQASDNKNDIRLTFLGCAGFIVEHNNKSILCDPYITNPGLTEFGKVHTPWTNYIEEEKLKTVNLVTISHGHYDHCYDMEDLCRYIHPSAKIIGDISVQHQLDAVYKNKTFQKNALQFKEVQTWTYDRDSTFRVFPLQSIHNPHIGNIEFLKGKYTAPLSEIPKRAWQWKKGEAYSYLIDVLQRDSIIYRMILVNGSLNEQAITALKQLSETRKSDIQLQIFWKEKLVTDNMNQIYAITQPKQIILHHWNNFFISNDQPLQYFRDAHLPEVLKSYNDKKMPMSVMMPFTTVNL